MSTKNKATNPKTKTTKAKSVKSTSAKAASAKSLKSTKAAKHAAKSTKAKISRSSAKQIAMHKRRLSTVSGVLLCLGAVCFIVFFILFWIFFHTCDLTSSLTLSALEIIFVLPLLVNILSLICALDCKHPLHSRTVILNIVIIAIETVFLAFIPLYLLVLR